MNGDMNHRDTETQRKKLNELSQKVIGLCIEVHRTLGPGLLESAYEIALAHELSLARLSFQTQVDQPVMYKGVQLDAGYRLDFMVEDALIIELKSVQEVLPVHLAQLMTYLKLNQKPLGLLINFHVPVLKSGIHRMVVGDTFR
jgi:GxxExxY protein